MLRRAKNEANNGLLLIQSFQLKILYTHTKFLLSPNERDGKLAFAFYSECSRGSSTQSGFKAKDLLLYNSLVIAS